MVFPVYKAIIVMLKTFMRPLNNQLKIIFIHKVKSGQGFFKWVGNTSHRLEVKVN